MHWRPYRATDFTSLPELMQTDFKAPPGVLRALPSLWRDLFEAGQLQGGVVVEESARGDSILCFAMSVFLREDFIAEYLDAPAPYPAALVYSRILEGRSPVLNARDIARVNAARELNILFLHYYLRHPSSTDARGREIMTASHTTFGLNYAGYGLKRLLQEAYGDEQPPIFASAGMLLKSDYGDWFVRHGVPRPASNERPSLMGLFSEDPESRNLGSLISYLFLHQAPRFRFTAAEQTVLLHALMDEGDETIATALGLSHDTIKKTWRRIHERVVAADAALYEGDVAADTSRGKERRRQLLRYLRHHAEELRPLPRRRT